MSLFFDPIKSIGYDEGEMIRNIISLHLEGKRIDCDPTFSIGSFYKRSCVEEPVFKSDLFPQRFDVIKSNANKLEYLENNSIERLMFDPPFIGGRRKESQGLIANRFGEFPSMKDLLFWYNECLEEFSRVLKQKGKLIVKCQDVVSSRKQYWSHVKIINQAENLNFYLKDMFILLAKSRMVSPNQKNQIHARKYHCYFLIFENMKQVEDE